MKGVSSSISEFSPLASRANRVSRGRDGNARRKCELDVRVRRAEAMNRTPLRTLRAG
jgi:hypothetical protein